MIRRRTCGATVALMLFAGCGAGEDVSEPDPDGTTTSTRAPTSSTTSATSPMTTTEPVSFDVEVRRAAIELLEVRNAVFRSADPERVDEYLSSLCTCYSDEVAALEALSAAGHRWSEAAIEPLGVRLITDDSVAPRLVAIVRQHPIEVVDGNGTVINSSSAIERAALAVSLQRNDSGEWRLGLFANNPNFDPLLGEEIIAEGLP